MNSNGQPAVVPDMSKKIDVKFISIAPQIFPIKHSVDDSINYQKNDFLLPGLFQIAAKIEKAAMPPVKKPTVVVTEKEFAALRMEAMKSRSVESRKSFTKTSPTESCGWTFTIRKECLLSKQYTRTSFNS